MGLYGYEITRCRASKVMQIMYKVIVILNTLAEVISNFLIQSRALAFIS
jgi:hypothetical protein